MLYGIATIFRLATCFGLLLLSGTAAYSQQPFFSACSQDAQLDATSRKAVDDIAIKFVNTFLGPVPSGAFEFLSKDAKAATTTEQFEGISTAIRKFEPTRVAVQHTYLLKLKGKSPGRVVCSSDLSKSDNWVSLEAQSVPEQAYAVLSADTINNKLAITLWLLPERNTWKIQDFRLSVATLGNEDSKQLLELARTQQALKHSLNAALLYAAAAQTANRGPNFQLGIAQSIANEISAVAVPDEIKGQPPFLWRDGETTYKVTSVSPMAIGGKIYIVITHEVSPWKDNEQVDGWNRNLLTHFKRRFPEYSDSFAGLVVRATEQGGNRGYGTVEEVSAAK